LKRLKFNLTKLKITPTMKDALNANSQEEISPEQALELLKTGNSRFAEKRMLKRDLLKMVEDTSTGQWPFAVVLSCIDSRTSSELIFDQGIGHIFNARVAGNIVNEDILGSLEYSVKHAKAKIVVVLGHTKCGAVTSACKEDKSGIEGYIPSLLEKIKPAIEKAERSGTNEDFVEKVAKLNVFHSLELIRTQSETLSDLEKNGEVMLVGGMYDVGSGRVEFYEG
jgi:carbonic anhydrase